MPNIVKNTTKIGLLELLIPHSCRGCGRIGNILCNCCKNYIIHSHYNFCPICKTKNQNGECKKHPNLPPAFVVSHRTGLIDQLIHEYKYNSVHALALPLAEFLNQVLPNTKYPSYIVPMPTISRHIRERGLDHTKKIAKKLARMRSSWQVQPILLRSTNTVQVGTNRNTRLQQAQAAYQLNPNMTIDTSATYILIDDVWTTGASILSAVKKLRTGGAKQIVVALLAVSDI